MYAEKMLYVYLKFCLEKEFQVYESVHKLRPLSYLQKVIKMIGSKSDFRKISLRQGRMMESSWERIRIYTRE